MKIIEEMKDVKSYVLREYLTYLEIANIYADFKLNNPNKRFEEVYTLMFEKYDLSTDPIIVNYLMQNRIKWINDLKRKVVYIPNDMKTKCVEELLSRLSELANLLSDIQNKKEFLKIIKDVNDIYTSIFINDYSILTDIPIEYTGIKLNCNQNNYIAFLVAKYLHDNKIKFIHGGKIKFCEDFHKILGLDSDPEIFYKEVSKSNKYFKTIEEGGIGLTPELKKLIKNNAEEDKKKIEKKIQHILKEQGVETTNKTNRNQT